MTQQDRVVKWDRMRYTKDKTAANLVLAAIVLDALYFVSIYKTDVGNYYYNWIIGASVVYNLLFLLSAFLASEGVKSRKTGYTPLLIVIGLLQFARIFYLPQQAKDATVTIQEVVYDVMGQGQYLFVIGCLAVSGVCCVAAAVISSLHNRTLNRYLHLLESQNQ